MARKAKEAEMDTQEALNRIVHYSLEDIMGDAFGRTPMTSRLEKVQRRSEMSSVISILMVTVPFMKPWSE